MQKFVRADFVQVPKYITETFECFYQRLVKGGSLLVVTEKIDTSMLTFVARIEEKNHQLSFLSFFQTFGPVLCRTVILKDVTLKIFQGHITAVLGRNGAGKSTLLRMILGKV